MARNKLQQEADVALHVLSFNEFSSDEWLNHEVLKLNGKISEAKLRYVLSDEHQQLGRLDSHHQQEIRRICVPIIDGRIKDRNANNPALLASKAAEDKMQALTDQLAALTAEKNTEFEQAIPDPVQAPAPQVAFGAPIEQEQVTLTNVVAAAVPYVAVTDTRKPEVATSDIITTLGTYKSIQGLLGRISPMYPTIDMFVLQGMADKLIDSEGVTHLRKNDEFITVTEALVDACTLYQKSVLLEIPFRMENVKGVLFDEEETTKIEATPTVMELDEEVGGSSEKEDVTQYVYGIGKMKKWEDNVIYPHDFSRFVKHATAKDNCKEKNDSIGEKVYKIIKLK